MTTVNDSSDMLTNPYQRGPALGVSQWYLGALFTWLARAEDTGGAFALADVRARPGSEPPPHTHTHEDEAMLVISGEITFHAGEQAMPTSAGQIVYLPRGVEHGFTITSPEAHFLLIISPAGLETTFDELSEPALALTPPEIPAGPPPADLMATVLAAYTAAGVRFTTPTSTQQP
ncbi:cupin domain-containing protein [Actinokineospora sp.]|uniref:cupin domain-containing protein n=1 Tax=Actinokineospora sp. TaxID=1872133 RepID=UPI003D6BC816